MAFHFELAQGTRRSTIERCGDGFFIDGCIKLGATLPTELLGVDGYAKLSASQFIRLSRELGSESFPDLKGKQVQLLKELCLVAKCSEEFFLDVSRDQWLRTSIVCRNKDCRALFSSEVIEHQCHTLMHSITIHSNVVPRYPYWLKLQAVREEASTRVYFPSTFLDDVAMSENKSLAERLSEWEEREEECAIARQWHERFDNLERDDQHRTSRLFWKIEPDDVELVNTNFAEGSQASVWTISWRGGVFARKVFNVKDDFETELDVVRRVSGHPHIVCSFGVSMNTDEKAQHSLLMELLDRDLSALIEDRVRLRGYSEPPFSRPDSVLILLQVAKAMAYIHDLAEPVIHGDLKPENILVSECEILGEVCQYFVKVADFGSAKILSEPNSSSAFSPAGGTTPWAAPEVLKARTKKTSIVDDPTKIDVYSFGIVAFQVLTGLVPYEGVSSCRELIEGVIAGTLRPPIQEECSRPKFWSDRPDLIALVTSCWHPDPSERSPFSEVANRLERIYNEVTQMNGSIVDPLPQANAVDAPPRVLTNGSNAHPQSQANAVDDAPQSNSTARHGPAPSEVNEVNDATTAAQVCLQNVQAKPGKASRMRISIRGRLLSCICISPPKTSG